MVNVGSQVGGDRAVSFVSFAPDEIPLLATSNWSGVCTLWSLPNLDPIMHFNESGHKDRATCIKFHPMFSKNDAKTLDLASCGSDTDIYLWSRGQSNPIASLQGHKLAINRK